MQSCCDVVYYLLEEQKSVAEGSKIEVRVKIDKFKCQFQGHQFQADFMLILLGCHDIVFGVQWLHALGPITWEFQER